MKKMFGVNTPISTPMTQDQQVDYASLERLCDHLIQKGVHGLYPNGSTGEVVYLTLEERKKVLESCLKATNGRAQVFSMVGAATTRDTIELARHAQSCGADGIGVVTPYYYRLDADELFEHYLAVSKSVSADFPIYLYGIPQCAVNDLTVEMAERVAQKMPNVVGIKYSYPDMDRLMGFANVNGGSFSLLVGPDELLYPALCIGAHGTISGTSNAIPAHFVGIYDAFMAGDHQRAAELQRKTNRMIEVISGPNMMARYKAVLKYQGIIGCDRMRSPLRQLTDAERDDLIRYLEEVRFTEV